MIKRGNLASLVLVGLVLSACGPKKGEVGATDGTVSPSEAKPQTQIGLKLSCFLTAKGGAAPLGAMWTVAPRGESLRLDKSAPPTAYVMEGDGARSPSGRISSVGMAMALDAKPVEGKKLSYSLTGTVSCFKLREIVWRSGANGRYQEPVIEGVRNYKVDSEVTPFTKTAIDAGGAVFEVVLDSDVVVKPPTTVR